MGSSDVPNLAPKAAQRQALDEAAEWYATLCSGSADTRDEQRLQAWLAGDALHRWAWERVGQLQTQLGQLPGSLAVETLGRSEQYLQRHRRQLLKGVVLAIGAGPLGWAAYRSGAHHRVFADQYTSAGEVKSLRLADGSQLVLNTATAVDIRFTANTRQLILKQGEVLVETAKPSATDEDSRPFIVDTPAGQVRALGTRFTVRTMDGEGSGPVTRVNVYQHRVEVTNGAGQRQICPTGSRMDFSDTALYDVRSPTQSDAWMRERLVVDNMPLDAFIAELGRYRTGILRCDPDVAHYKISGVFMTNDTDQALRAVAKSFPVTVRYRSRYWVTISR
ncbi:MAG TPA: iron dicitrate transport regulator FecR [Gammaproteobacteria bacterium]|nr:iron dicitrate transport regulator FecR [Gammaproteobacteria bacterium]